MDIKGAGISGQGIRASPIHSCIATTMHELPVRRRWAAASIATVSTRTPI